MSYCFQSFQPYFSQLISYHPTSWSLYTCPYYYTPQLLSINCILNISCCFPITYTYPCYFTITCHHSCTFGFLTYFNSPYANQIQIWYLQNTRLLNKQSIHCHLTWTLNLFPQHIFRHLSILIGDLPCRKSSMPCKIQAPGNLFLHLLHRI